MRVTKALLVFALLIPWGALAQTSACGSYEQKTNGFYKSEYVFIWFATQGDPTALDIALSPGWKSWVSVTNLAIKEGVSIRFDFLKPTGGGYGQTIWATVRGGVPKRFTADQFGMHPGETVEVRLLAQANSEAGEGYPIDGLAVGTIKVAFTSLDPCDLDLQGKMSLMFLEIADGADGKKKVTRLGSIDPVKVSSATNRVFINVTGTPFWARAGNPAVEIPSFALTNLDPLPQDIKVSLLGPDGNPVVAPKFITLAGGAVTATEVETLFGVEAFNSTGKVFAGRLVFEGTGHLSAIALQFVGDSAMGSKKVFTF